LLPGLRIFSPDPAFLGGHYFLPPLLAGFLRAMPASDIAIAIACLRLVTFLPELDLSVPAEYSDMTFSTFFWAFVGFLAMS